MSPSLLDRYGRAKVVQIVASFYRDVLRSPRLGRYFENVNMDALILHQSEFMKTTLAGKPSYTNAELDRAHQPLEISEADFEEMIRLLSQALRRRGVAPDDGEQVIQTYRRYTPYIVHRGD